MRLKLLTVASLTAILSVSLYASCQDLVNAYPHRLKECKNNMLIWKDGTKMVYDDGKKKNFDQLLNHPDLEDMFHFRYIKGKSTYNKPPAKNYDPGRIRNEKFFTKMYGKKPAEVRRKIDRVRWLPKSSKKRIFIRVTKENGVNIALKRVSKELDSMVLKDPSLKKYLIPPAGGYYWRKIAGTKRLSVHSFGAAVDINPKQSNYWRWSKGKYKYRNKIPYSIVHVFEKNGFIWGGKWYHYDTMHFEYRPELLGMKSAK